jgi:hypothetical protein
MWKFCTKLKKKLNTRTYVFVKHVNKKKIVVKWPDDFCVVCVDEWRNFISCQTIDLKQFIQRRKQFVLKLVY